MITEVFNIEDKNHLTIILQENHISYKKGGDK